MLISKLPSLLALALCLLYSAGARAQQTQPQDALPQLIRRVKPSVVSVITYNARGEVAVTGSGFFIRPGEVVTNLHVVEGAQRVEIRTFDGKGKTYAVEGLKSIDEDGDLALMSVEMPAERSRILEVTGAAPEEGERIFVIGNPLRLEGSISDGIVSAVREVPSLGRIIQITAPISHGNSGSPVFNMRGQVIGIVTIKVTNGQNINLAMSAQRLAGFTVGERLIAFDETGTKKRASGQPDAISEWWYRNGLNSLWLGNYDNALSHFENAVSKNPNRADAWIQVGFCKVKQGKNADAIRAFERALKLRPDSVEAHNKLGDAYYYAGNFYRAIESYKRAIEIRPRDPEGYYNLGLAYLETGDRSAAIAQAITLKSLDSELHKKLSNEIER